MSSALADFERLISVLAQVTRTVQYEELPEHRLVGMLQENIGDYTTALEKWEEVAAELRQPVVRDGRVFEWNLFRRVMCVSRLPGPEELERFAELYRRSAPEQIDRRIRALSGGQFERFLGELLRSLPNFRGIHVTQISRDGGIDFRGKYAPDPRGPEWPLLGQAKQVIAPASVREARDFIGALDTSGQAKAFGLFVSTAGFTDPAHDTLQRSRYPIIIWGPEELRERVFEASMGLRRVSLVLDMIDETFWDELSGRPQTG
jgi:restriction endonuclease Mrr